MIAAICPLVLSAEGERTLSIIKPDAVAGNHIGSIIDIFEKANLKVIGLKMVKLSPEEAGRFYAVHKSKPFFDELVKYISSGPIVALVLKGDGAVARNRNLMGATDPTKAEAGTLRALYGKSIEANAVHGSDSAESAEKEIAFFFKPSEIY